MLVALLALISGLPAETAAKVEKVDAVFTKVGPGSLLPGRSKSQTRAVVLIHGLQLNPVAGARAAKAVLRPWQQADAVMVNALAEHADVYALGYAQTVAVEKVHEGIGLAGHVKGLKKAGYKEVILVGHSAGGLVARHFVEDVPDAGVTKVIQVCCPNGGSTLAALKAAGEAQLPFLTSLSRTARTLLLEKRKETVIPAGVEFACVIGTLRLGTDGIVSNKSQWTEDLQKQGVPAHLLRTAHWDAMKTSRGAEFLAKLIREPQPRWKEEQVKEARRKYLDD